MKKRLKALTLGFLLLASPLLAHEFKLGHLEIVHPNSRAMVAGAPVGGGYLKIINRGKTDDRLVSARSSRAGVMQLHEMTIENDVMKMREVSTGIAIPAGATVELKPGGLHVMFMKVPQPFKEGEMVEATLIFEKAGSVDVEFEIGPASGGASEMNHGHAATP
ncbi:copper chaperone PCu(A)C [Rhizobium skierniewicense]|uniref:copper chaperone PCu(A)C n=1 Tax=Rhizobium skierniewicense TaxID=984260 RepID=UPI001FADF6D2|nr:copper chaperone PCu(A)C [Rhizobium skierniewicense]MCI9868413.1 copper chaperone PCu(A)C [Rhizobium skierniewicense]